MKRIKMFGITATSAFTIIAIYALQHQQYGVFTIFVMGATITAYLYLRGE
jgi:hypothetical protein